MGFMLRGLLAAIGVVALVTGAPAQPPTGPSNLDFEQGAPGAAPSGWFTPLPTTKASLSDQGPHQGKQCLVLSRTAIDSQSGGFANVMQAFDATPFRGKRVALTAAVKVDATKAAGGPAARAQLWLRVDRTPGPNGEPGQGFFDNMGDRPITSGDWKDYTITGDIDRDAAMINIGMFLTGGGVDSKAYLDDVRFKVLGDVGAGTEPPRPLTERSTENLVAFARLLGYVRFFHPSDQAAAADWDAVAISGVRAVESAETPEQLAAALSAVFKPLGPTIRIETHRIDGPLDPATLRPAAPEPTDVIAWRHLGLGNSSTPSNQTPYRSTRIHHPISDAGAQPLIPPVGAATITDLGRGVWCSVPITLYADDAGTLPHADTPPSPRAQWPEAFEPSGNDRATRLADVILLWTILQNFYPYFDVVGTDWNAILPEALKRAAADKDRRAFLSTLRWMTAQLHDGHANVMHPAEFDQFGLPLAWAWIESQLVVTAVGPEAASGPARGDVVLSIDGVPAADALAAIEREISGATPGWIRSRSLVELTRSRSGGPAVLELKSPDGALRTVRLAHVSGVPLVTEPRPDKITELKPGIWYVDLDKVNDQEFNRAVDDLAGAKGIIFDLRGYPRLGTGPLAHLIDQPITSARWNIPILTRPDREQVEYQFSNWPVPPAEPRFTAKVAFLTDGRAISYAETYMGMVEHYKLAAIVGERTAGTNGNINPISLPGGYSTVFTGMKVLKHDKSQHHGIGIIPTVETRRTIKGVREGRDEVLDKGIEVVSRGAAPDQNSKP